MAMSSSRPYMIRALYDWIVDNNCTPYILVDAMMSGVEVPQQHVNKDGQIVLNISPTAVMGLSLDNQAVSFNARFGGIPTDIFVPSRAVLGIYARENGQGMVFEPELEPEPEPTPPKGPAKKPVVEKPAVKSAGRPSLRVVK
ncbi:ClpXP protease specificity-enhancing factor [Simiduia agarivorans]|uniref:ClpXP protease specificity-enhancing factor n=1 Tax=Simiduia agarivorans (strain DSM 21679 / JCM 13881 / BCRC 17597 / SA1) TaxID=1117647 RepID=K4KND7_SIMAS|nr:ClpXP protease specificity-enhancing factor [Simiduia agarivorans]AFV00660.1 ClpXP protease specificity-enhancing factor [Simiduia agarivorans SA1 = DSM 21679]